jgi:hypothetical protein
MPHRLGAPVGDYRNNNEVLLIEWQQLRRRIVCLIESA